MFRKPVRTYQRKKGTVDLHPVSNINTISRDEVSSDQTPKVGSMSDIDDSLNYDLFDTTFDRLVKDVIVHPIPQDQVSNQSYDDSSDDAAAEKGSASDGGDDPLLNEPLTNPSPKWKSRGVKKRGNNKRQRLGSAKTNVTTKSETKTIKRRVKAEPKTHSKDENAEPNVERSQAGNYGEKKKYVRVKRVLKKRPVVDEVATTPVQLSTKRKVLEDSKVLVRCIVNLERLSFPIDTSLMSRNQKTNERKKARSNNSVSGDSREIDQSRESTSTTKSTNSTDVGASSNHVVFTGNPDKQSMEISENPVVSLSKEAPANNQGSVEFFDSGTDISVSSKIRENRKNRSTSPVGSVSFETSNNYDQFVDSTEFRSTSNHSQPKETVEKRKTKPLKQPFVSLSRKAFTSDEQAAGSTDYEITSNRFESKKMKGKRKRKLVEKPVFQRSKEVLTNNEKSINSSNNKTTSEMSNYQKIEDTRKNNVENPVVLLSQVAPMIVEQSVDSAESQEPSENVEPVKIQQTKRTKLLQKPIVSCSRLSLPRQGVSHNFSSSTPIVTRATTAQSLRLSPIKSNFNEDLEASLNLKADISPSKPDTQAADSVSKKVASSLTMKPTEESELRAGDRRSGILSITPDPDPSELLFNDTEVRQVGNDQSVPLKPDNYSKVSHPSANGPSSKFEKESSNRETSRLIFDKTEDSFRFSSSLSSRDSSVCNEDTLESTENSKKDPFMGCPDERADAPNKQNLSDKSRNSDDDWITISGSLNSSNSKSLFETREHFEQSSSEESKSSDETTEFVRADEMSIDQIVSDDHESSVRLSEMETTHDSIDNLEKSETTVELPKTDSQENYRPLEAVVLLSRLTRSKINQFKNDHDSLNKNLSHTSKSFSHLKVDEDLTVDQSVLESTNVDETSFENLKPMSPNDFEGYPSEMESLRIDGSSGNTTEKSSEHETLEKNSNVSASSINTAVSLNEENEEKILELPQEEGKSDASEPKDSTREEKLQNSSVNNESLEDERRDSMQPVVLLSRLNDPFRITRRRNEYRNWGFNLSAIREIDAEKVSTKNTHMEKLTNASKMNGIPEELSQATTISVGIGNSQILHEIPQKTDDSCSTSFTPNQQNDSAREDKVVYLKPGKSWARSLSILNHVHSQEDLEFLAVGKGKKWRQSVQNILGMQQQGLIQSCVNKNEDSKELPLFTGLRNSTAWIPGSSQPDTSRLFGISSPGRFIRRVSIRVVPDCKSFDNIKDTSFLEAYGIKPIENKQATTQRSTLKDPRKTLDVIPRNLCSTKPRDVVFAQCGQKSSLPFDECYPQSFLENCRKIGEGVYGEVFLYEKGSEKNVIKIIPIEGDMKINSERQKKFDEILSEIVIAKELHNLRFTDQSNTNCFVEVKKIRCVKGKYPQILIDLWKNFDEEKNSENDCPSIFEENQLYIVLELGHGGEDLEAYVFQNAREAHALFIQTALALAVAEESLEFEHRDLHWGNLLITRTDEPRIDFKLKNKSFSVSSRGVKVSVIDFTLSRMSYQGCSIFNDLSMDEDLFVAQGEYQFEIYRLMRNKLENNWQRFEPYTNILWLHYVLDKMITAARYRRKNTKVHKSGILDLQVLKDEILEYDSAVDFVTNCDKATRLQASRTSVSEVVSST